MMSITPHSMRLDKYFQSIGRSLSPPQSSLAVQVIEAEGDRPDLKRAAHAMRKALHDAGVIIRQSQAFEALAAYFGARDWNALVVTDPRTPKAGVSAMFERLDSAIGTGVRLAFRVEEKSEGVENLKLGLTLLAAALPPNSRVRLISSVSSGEWTPPTAGGGSRFTSLADWRKPALKASPAILRRITEHRIRGFEELALPGSENMASPQGARELSHLVLVEVPLLVAPAAQDEAILRSAAAVQESAMTAFSEADWLVRPADPRQVSGIGGWGNWHPETLHWALAASGVGLPCKTLFAACESRFAVVVDLLVCADHMAAVTQYGLIPSAAECVDPAVLLPGSATLPLHSPAPLTTLLSTLPFVEGVHRVTGHGLPVLSRHGVLHVLNTDRSVRKGPGLIFSVSPGRGASYLIDERIAETLAQGGRVRVVDSGRGRTKLTNVFGGVFERLIALKPKLPPSFPAPAVQSVNPLSGLVDSKALKASLPALTTFLLNTAHQHAEADTLCFECDESLRNNVEQAILSAWNSNRVHLEPAHVREEIDRLGAGVGNVAAFSKALRGALVAAGDLLRGPFFTDMSNSLTVFEVEDLEVYPTMKKLVAAALVCRFEVEMYRAPTDAETLFVLLEPWAWGEGLTKEQAEHLLDACERRNGFIVAHIHHPVDARLQPFLSEVWRASYKLVKNGRDEDVTALVDDYNLSGREAALLRTVTENRDPMEFAWFSPEHLVGIYSVRFDRYTDLAYTTNPRAIEPYLKLRREGMSSSEALDRAYAERYGTQRSTLNAAF